MSNSTVPIEEMNPSQTCQDELEVKDGIKRQLSDSTFNATIIPAIIVTFRFDYKKLKVYAFLKKFQKTNSLLTSKVRKRLTGSRASSLTLAFTLRDNETSGKLLFMFLGFAAGGVINRFVSLLLHL